MSLSLPPHSYRAIRTQKVVHTYEVWLGFSLCVVIWGGRGQRSKDTGKTHEDIHRLKLRSVYADYHLVAGLSTIPSAWPCAVSSHVPLAAVSILDEIALQSHCFS